MLLNFNIFCHPDFILPYFFKLRNLEKSELSFLIFLPQSIKIITRTNLNYLNRFLLFPGLFSKKTSLHTYFPNLYANNILFTKQGLFDFSSPEVFKILTVFGVFFSYLLTIIIIYDNYCYTQELILYLAHK